MTMIPTVITNDGRGERAYDIYSRLLKDGIIFLRGVIDDDLASTVLLATPAAGCGERVPNAAWGR